MQPPQFILSKSGFAHSFISIVYVLAGAAGGADVVSKSMHPGWPVYLMVFAALNGVTQPNCVST